MCKPPSGLSVYLHVAKIGIGPLCIESAYMAGIFKIRQHCLLYTNDKHMYVNYNKVRIQP